jgi:hypothetical protein
LQTRSEVIATLPNSSSTLARVVGRLFPMPSTTAATDAQLMGAEITFGAKLIGHVEGLVRDPLSQRVRGLITSYGLKRRRVTVPMEWVTKRSTSRLVLAVGEHSLDDLGERIRP